MLALEMALCCPYISYYRKWCIAILAPDSCINQSRYPINLFAIDQRWWFYTFACINSTYNLVSDPVSVRYRFHIVRKTQMHKIDTQNTNITEIAHLGNCSLTLVGFSGPVQSLLNQQMIRFELTRIKSWFLNLDPESCGFKQIVNLNLVL